jgi:hypothetical protein
MASREIICRGCTAMIAKGPDDARAKKKTGLCQSCRLRLDEEAGVGIYAEAAPPRMVSCMAQLKTGTQG